MDVFLKRMLAGLAAVAAIAVAPSPASGQINRHIYFYNQCPAPVRLFVYHQHNDGQWATHGWFTAGASTAPLRLEYGNGSPLVHIDGRPLYFYAESTGGGRHIWEGRTRASFNGVSYGLETALLNMNGGQLQFGINCNSAPAPAPAPAAVNWNIAPSYGALNLVTGFLPDPRIVNVQAGGPISAQRVGSNCRGYINQAPTLRLNYRAGTSFPLVISAESGVDTTLVIRAPDGSFYCDDDGGANGLNPGLRFTRPMSGRYDIWLGTYSTGPRQAARLHVSEIATQ